MLHASSFCLLRCTLMGALYPLIMEPLVSILVKRVSDIDKSSSWLTSLPPPPWTRRYLCCLWCRRLAPASLPSCLKCQCFLLRAHHQRCSDVGLAMKKARTRPISSKGQGRRGEWRLHAHCSPLHQSQIEALNYFL
jgi:hypothetical protein